MTNDVPNPGERHLEAATGTEPLTTAADVQAQDVQAHPAGLLSAGTDRLVLHEERADVQVVREALGQVTVRKAVTEREEMIPVTLRSEVLEITVQPGAGRVIMDGRELEPGQTYTVELTTERAAVTKEVVPVSEVTLGKRVLEETRQETVTLRREVLDVQDPQNLIANRAELGDLR